VVLKEIELLKDESDFEWVERYKHSMEYQTVPPLSF
jgi:hypothetical protein